MPTLLDELERDLWKRGANWRPDHYEDYKAVLALVAVARAAVRVSNETALSAHKRPTFRASHALVAALTPLLAERGEGAGHAE